MKLILTALSILIIATASLLSDTVKSKSDGNWSEGSSWISGKVPQAGDTVIIATAIRVTKSTETGIIIMTETGHLTVDKDIVLKTDEIKNVNNHITNYGTIEVGK